MPRNSEDFLEFDTNDLIEELSRRCMTLVLAAEFEGEGEVGDEELPSRIKFHHYGYPFAKIGLADLLFCHIRRQGRELLDYLE